jgi:hypothetical protein
MILGKASSEEACLFQRGDKRSRISFRNRSILKIAPVLRGKFLANRLQRPENFRVVGVADLDLNAFNSFVDHRAFQPYQ